MIQVVYLPHTLTSPTFLARLWVMNSKFIIVHSSNLATLPQSMLSSCLVTLLSTSVTYPLMHPPKARRLRLSSEHTLTIIKVASSSPMLSLRCLHHKKLTCIGRLPNHRTPLSNLCRIDITKVLCTMRGRRTPNVLTITYAKGFAQGSPWDTVVVFANPVMVHHMEISVPT